MAKHLSFKCLVQSSVKPAKGKFPYITEKKKSNICVRCLVLAHLQVQKHVLHEMRSVR